MCTAGRCVAMAAALGAARAHAGAWSADADLSLSAAYDDNVRFVSRGAIADQYGVAEAGANLQWHGEATTIGLRPSARGYYYRHYDPYNRTDGYLTLTSRHRSQRSRYDLTLTGAVDTTLTSEFQFTGFRYADANKRHESLSATLAPQWDLTERISVVASGSWSRHRYIDAQLTPLVDYDYRSAMLGLQRNLTVVSTLELQATAARLSLPSRSLYDKDSFQVVADYTRQFGPRWSLELAAGPSRVHSLVLHRDDNGFVYSANLERKGEAGHLAFTAGRTVSPNGLGALARRDTASIDARRQVTERLGVSANLAWVHVLNSQVTGGFTAALTDYLDGGLGVDWRPAPTWNLQLSVHSYRQSYGTGSDTARKGIAQLQLTWNGLQHVAG